ncbi:inovirus Gp2 family protein [Salmonella enterica]|uniref:Inovirus Gp2 family protein n=3 Tax=Salmonella enterica TaxID=28901 RepID=A0A756DMC1_SALER|nr:inovirus Gp2 family protein [Salmonella enterica subsp. enterica serovar Javiana]EAN0513842.1 inovirus Gp2 family protein [Salmonella enterica]ECE5830322.1 hypothetical protein [Salmonella enterica subsp. enterica]ECU5731694.1 inovirus Gp2 family protein [Salmonella enterica subsp. enterica serovar 9,12:-:1,5]EHF3058326.1 inovirus Gp2 family protein [Salmonella enterica subsp. enterica serovar 9,12-:1,5]
MSNSLINQVTKPSPGQELTSVFNTITPDKPGNLVEYQPKGTFVFKEVMWSVLPEKRDQDTKIMKRIFGAVDKVSAMSRFLAVRYDFRLPTYSADNRIMDDFHNLLFRQLSKNYPKSFISYLWVREQGSGEAQHYHYLLMLDGNYIRYPNKLNTIVRHCWEQVAGGSVWFPENGYYFVSENDLKTYTELMLRVSYLGKRRTKESIDKGIKLFGSGMRKPKPVAPSRQKPAITPCKPINQKSETKTNDQDMALKSTYSGMLDKYFLGKARLPAVLRKRSSDELYDENKWWCNSPRWSGHRHNYALEALITGISLSEYAHKYRLNQARVYANCRRVGGQSLKIIHWAWHRYCFQKSKSTLDDYINNHRLNQKTAKKQLRRKPMSPHWSQHFDRYYQKYWPKGWTVADYCREHNLVASTARRYIVDFPFIDLIDPFLLKPWL